MNFEKLINSIIRKVIKQRIELKKRIRQYSKVTYEIYRRTFCAVDDEDYKKLEKAFDDALECQQKLVYKLIIYNKIIKRKFIHIVKNNYLLIKDERTNTTMYRKKLYF